MAIFVRDVNDTPYTLEVRTDRTSRTSGIRVYDEGSDTPGLVAVYVLTVADTLALIRDLTVSLTVLTEHADNFA